KQIKAILQVLLSLLILESVFAIHEYGHLTEFLKRGVPVQEILLGIGPLMYQYQTPSFAVSFRLIPIMAYVAPTQEGGNLFNKQGTLWDKIAVNVAGARNNFAISLIIIFFFQILGWTKGNLSARELARTMMVTPCKLLLRFFAFLVGCMTLGRVNLAEKFLLSTGRIDPPKPLKKLICWNLALGLFNLVPIPPLDGGHIVQAIIFSTGAGAYTSHIPNLVGFILFVMFFMAAGHQDMRILEHSHSIEPQL
ncbi:MAG: M50 family metallopeptidase, partial [Candidatus Sungbacteria bacterium]|nr:M50 family metallopeptidase [Candidatus Sungbacteria bacterium]